MIAFSLFFESTENFASVSADDMNLPQEVYQLSDLFEKNGKLLFVVGGAVRDYLFAKYHGGNFSPKDIDLATEATPQEIISILETDKSIRIVPKGEKFGVISAIVNGEEYEIASFREEVYDKETGDGRRPDEVKFSTPEKDAKRRDLTINALFYDISNKEIRDYNLNTDGTGQGIEDIKKKLSRPVGSARDRFTEDKLRIPRLLRFFSRFNPGEIQDHLDQETLSAIKDLKDLAGVSPERIAVEFVTGLKKSINTANFIRNYYNLDLMNVVFPGLIVNLRDLENIGDNKNYKAIIAWLLRDNQPQKIRTLLNKAKYSNDVVDRVTFLVSLYNFNVDNVYKLLRQRDSYKSITDEIQRDLVKKDMEKDIVDFAEISKSNELLKFVRYEMAINSEEFAGLSGKAFGDAMARSVRDNYMK